MRRYCLITHFLLLFSLSLSAQKIVFTPQWKPQSQFAGYYAAQKLGYYKEAGLDVNFLYMEASTAAITSLRENRSQVITLMLSQALKECDEGNQLVNLLQTSQRSSLVLISNPDKPLNQVSQFKGIRIGYFNAGFNEIPEAFNRIARLGWEPIYFEQSFNLLLYGVIDATVAMEYNEMQQVIYSGVSVSEKMCSVLPTMAIMYRRMAYILPKLIMKRIKGKWMHLPKLAEKGGSGCTNIRKRLWTL